MELGIEPSQLYYMTKSEFFQSHPELNSATAEIKNRRYQHYDMKRKEKIERAIQERGKFLGKSKSTNNLIASHNIDKENEIFNQGVSSAELRDQEQFEMMRKQNLCEIKNLIDYEIDNANIRNINEAKLRKQQQEDNARLKKALEEKAKKENRIRQMEIEKEEEERKEQKRQTQKYKEFFLIQQIKAKQDQQKELENQKLQLRRQLENQRKEEEFRNAVEERFLAKQHDLEIKQDKMDKKANQREQRIGDNKNKIRQKYLMQSQLREIKIENARDKKLQNIQERLNKYNRKQQDIFKQRKLQEEQKKKELLENRIRCEEKEKKNNETRDRNAQQLEERRLKLLERFHDNDLRIKNQKEINDRHIRDVNYLKAVKRLDADENVKEKEMQLKYKNTLKLQEIMKRQKRAEDLQRKRYLLSQKKIRMKDEMKDKKDELIHRVTSLLSKGKVCNKEDVYRQIFSKDELRILGQNRKSASVDSKNISLYKSDGFRNKNNSLDEL